MREDSLRDCSSRDLVARFAVVRVGRGLGVVAARPRVARTTAGQASSARASVRVRDRCAWRGAGTGVPGGCPARMSSASCVCCCPRPRQVRSPPRISCRRIRLTARARRGHSVSFTRGLSRCSASVPPLLSTCCSAFRPPTCRALPSGTRCVSWVRRRSSRRVFARGRVLPTLERREDHWLALWQPVTFDPEDSARLALLAESMPALLCAEVGASEVGRAPDAVVADMLGAVLDACARRFLAGGRRGRRRSPSAVEAWLAATRSADPVARGDDGSSRRSPSSSSGGARRWRVTPRTGRSGPASGCHGAG